MVFTVLSLIGLGGLIYFFAVNAKRTNLANKALILDYQNVIMLPDKPMDYIQSAVYLPFKKILEKEFIETGNV